LDYLQTSKALKSLSPTPIAPDNIQIPSKSLSIFVSFESSKAPAKASDEVFVQD
jgi:hypothetical protein